MTLAPRFAGQQLAAGGFVGTKHTLEIYLDYVCPFSAKLFHTFYPLITAFFNNPNSASSKHLQVIFRQQIQPWHPSSTLTHEAGLAVLKLAPEKFWPFSAALFAKQKEFFDVSVVNEKRNDTYVRLAKIGAEVGVDEGAMLKLLKISDQPDKDGNLNIGNGVTTDMKLMVKAARVVGTHVTPTVFFDGVEERSISSSFTREQWEEWLQKNVV
ncbi:conserved hypothetical protein [Histoplasma capsulatum G186AR]|uniref:Uncharacterized protein n=2 Tax=Ajellomyces capsulatus TaxID=5037 RepID=C0NNP8_AJECG|nr:uncharacterized protein HCBG_04778 [Histoplasma capsulatum G186AR]EEH06558.1 conserved hypothetical protein [Histoplasma capsulatum G186AR]KAG5304915.1 thioredoxin superfamily domain-containing protein [Histoplasma capsulatum]QSS75874.1 thioredoxin superfamily domain-containing protein [Histoplasma capsulatum G186AR]